MDLKYPSSIFYDGLKPDVDQQLAIQFFDDKILGVWSHGRGLGHFQGSFSISLVSQGQRFRSL